jgi:nitrate reductase gamma subunit
MSVLYLLTYLAVIVFLSVILYKIAKIASAPVHLRWELYPVPHEKGRAKYGGSILEEVDWWIKKRKKDHFGELKVMIPEIALLKGVWEHNKELWLGSFPFHFALYLFIANMFLLIIGTLLYMTGISPLVIADNNYFWKDFWIIYRTVIDVFWWAGSIIGILGAFRLLFVRIVDRGMALYSNVSHYFNIILIGAIYATALIWRLTDPKALFNLQLYYFGLMTFSYKFIFNTNIALPGIAVAHVVICALFAIYLPFTHMTHFFAKYFTYHKVRWEDEANIPGSKIAEKLAVQLNQTVTWAAPHIGADGNKNWIVIATSAPGKEK